MTTPVIAQPAAEPVVVNGGPTPAQRLTSLMPASVTTKDGMRSSTWARPWTAPIAPAAATTTRTVSPPRSGSHMANRTVDSEHRAAIDRSMPPHRTTSVAPAARTTRGAEVRTAAVRLRWVKKSGSAIVSAASSAMSAMTGMNDVTRWAAVGAPVTTAGSAAGFDAGSVTTGVLISPGSPGRCSTEERSGGAEERPGVVIPSP